MLLVKDYSETGLFRHLSNHVFRSLQVQKYISYEGHLFFLKIFKIESKFRKSKKKLKKIFVSDIIPFENVRINCHC